MKYEKLQTVIEGLDGIAELLCPLFKKINYEGLGKEDAAEFKEHLKIAVKALEKQRPLKLIGEIGYRNCPICGTGVLGDYCYKCGQKLDWD